MYARVAHRRAASASAGGGAGAGAGVAVENALRSVLDRVGAPGAPGAVGGGGGGASSRSSSAASGSGSGGSLAGSSRTRHLEDPHLVGEEAAARARRARLARENGDDVLLREDRRWDWFLGEFSCSPDPPPSVFR